jgi:hypothetical protein
MCDYQFGMRFSYEWMCDLNSWCKSFGVYKCLVGRSRYSVQFGMNESQFRE